MTEQLTLEIIRKLPKAELHCHLDGSVRPSTVVELAKLQGVSLPTYDVQELTKLVTVREDCESLEEYLRGFQISLSVMQEKESITRIMYEVCEDAYNDGVRYIEVRFSPILHTEKGLTLSMVMEAVSDGQMVAQMKLRGMVVRIIVCGMRQMSSEVSLSLAEIAWRYKGRGVVGFDLAGPENGYSSRLHKDAFAFIRKKLINCTLHSGEASDWRSVHDSIRFCGAQRIGHGVRMCENEELVQFVVNKRIGVEVCLTSNLQTKAITSYREHPVRDYFDRGVVVVPCTDNVVVSGTTLSQEYFKLQEIFNFSLREIVCLLDNGFRSSFIDHALRLRLRAEAMVTTLQVLKDAGYDISSLESVSSHLNVGLVFPVVPRNKIQDTSQNESIQALYETRKEDWKELLRQVPKSDNNTTFNGSVSIDTLWNLFQADRESSFIIQQYRFLGAKVQHITDKESFRALIQCPKHTHDTVTRAIQFMAVLLQTKEQMRIGLDDIFKHAKQDNVNYFELFLRPSLHTKRGLSLAEVVNTIMEQRDELVKRYEIDCNIILYSDNGEDGIEQLRQTAFLVVEHKEKIAGFAHFGLNADRQDFSPQEIAVFNLLKKHQINVSMTSAFADPRSLLVALSDAGATRLSGCYAIHQERQLMDYLARNRVPVEFGITETSKKYLRESQQLTPKNKREIVQLYMEMGIQFTLCSFDLTLYPKTRSAMLYDLASYCKMDINQLLQLLYKGYRSSFCNYKDRVAMQEKSYLRCLELLKEHNFQYSGKRLFLTKQDD